MKQKYVVLLCGLLAVMGTLLVSIKLPAQNEQAVTLKQAVEIAQPAANKWDSDAVLVQIISTDAQDELNETNGISGKRNCWNIFFMSKNKATQYNIFVINGVVKTAHECKIPTYKNISLQEDVRVDSDKAVSIANAVGLYPVPQKQGWAVGYHFSLQFIRDTQHDDTAFLALTVYGQKENGNFCQVLIDPLSGEIMSIVEQIGYDENGRSIWENTKVHQ